MKFHQFGSLYFILKDIHTLQIIPVSLQYILFFTPTQLSKRQVASGFGGYLQIVKIFSNETFRKGEKRLSQ